MPHEGDCTAIDPVNEPDYNMRQIIKQSVLLEEHLNDERKRCGACIVKHFNHIMGLAEEAQSLAGQRIKEYPYLQESPCFYRKLYDKWLKCRNSSRTDRQCRFVADELRLRRRDLTKTYVLGGTYK